MGRFFLKLIFTFPYFFKTFLELFFRLCSRIAASPLRTPVIGKGLLQPGARLFLVKNLFKKIAYKVTCVNLLHCTCNFCYITSSFFLILVLN